MVWPCDTPPDTLKDHTVGYCTRDQEEGKAKKTVDGQHQGLDRAEGCRAHSENRGPARLALAVTDVFRGSSTTIPVMRICMYVCIMGLTIVRRVTMRKVGHTFN